MQELKDELLVYLPKLIKGAGDIARNFHSNKLDDGFKLLEQAIDGIEWVSKAYSSFINPETDNVDNLNKALCDINNSLSAKDYVMAGDIFEYEVSAILSNMYNGISRMNFN